MLFGKFLNSAKNFVSPNQAFKMSKDVFTFDDCFNVRTSEQDSIPLLHTQRQEHKTLKKVTSEVLAETMTASSTTCICSVKKSSGKTITNIEVFMEQKLYSTIMPT